MPNGQTKEGDTKGSVADGGIARPPAISLPKGGGAIRGIDEKFSVNPATGTSSLTVPIFTTPGRSDFYPKLSLSYDSGAGNGPFGLGWNLSIPSITRKTDKGIPRYQDAEESDLYCSIEIVQEQTLEGTSESARRLYRIRRENQQTSSGKFKTQGRTQKSENQIHK